MNIKSIMSLALLSFLSLGALGQVQAPPAAVDKGMTNNRASTTTNADAVSRLQPKGRPPLPLEPIAAAADCPPPCPGSGHTKPVIHVNTATQAQLAAIPGIGAHAARVIVQARAQKPFANGQDFAERVCSTASVDTGFEISIVMGSQQFSPRSGEPKSAGWKCAQGAKTYQSEGQTHTYVGHVTLLR